MFDATPAPSPLPKKLTILARWSLGLVLAAWLVFGLAWGALHWLIVPRIGEFRPALEARATQMLGVPVHIGAITAQTSGMIPSFELSNVQLFDAQGREALRLPRVLAALSPRSLLFLGFEQLYIDRPQLDIRRAADGRITVAGIDFSKGERAGQGGVDWFFSQLEFAIHDGSVRWTDEMRAAPTLELTQVDLVLRNRGRRHDMRVDATPPLAWGQRFSLRGMFQQPLLARGNGQWQDWDGQFYSDFPRVDLSELRRYAGLGVDLHQGNGALTAWLDVSRGQVVSGVADLALAEVDVTLGHDLQPLELLSVRGRLGGKLLAAGFEFSTQALQFDTRDGLHWPGGNVSVNYLGAEGKVAALGEVKGDRLDLRALSQIADRLPLDPAARAALLAYAPKGLVERFQASWQGPLEAPTKYDLKGRVSALELAAAQGIPGVRGANVDFDFNQGGGKASISMTAGALTLPKVFDEPVIDVAQLSTDVRWQISGEHMAVQLPNLKFGNADAQGDAQIKWETSDPLKSRSHARFPGLLDLQANLSRADGTRVYRYLPSSIHKSVRDYLHDTILAGSASAAKFRVRGDLHDFPFTDPKLGDFRISADVRNAKYAYVPRRLQPANALPWPALQQLSGELVIDRMQLQVKDARARMGANAGIQFGKLDAVIPDLNHSVVQVNGEARGPLAEGLGIVNGSPLGGMTGQALSRAVASGSADYKLKLTLPIAAIDKSMVQGSVTLAGNDLQITPDTPRLLRTRAVINFSETGLSVVNAQTRMLGGDVRLDGGSVPLAGATGNAARLLPSLQFRATGSASAEGLRQAKELGLVARLAQQASGSAAYSAVLAFRRGEPELLVTSNLQGLGLSLPAPFNKSADSVLPFRFETALQREALLNGAARLSDQLTLDVGRLANLVYVRDLSGATPRVLRGSVAVGLSALEAAPLPEDGVVANVNLNAFDLDAWNTLLSPAGGSVLSNAAGNNAAQIYLPTRLAVRARELTFGGRKLHNVVVGGTRDGLLWRANLDANEFSGYMEYRQASDAGAGRVYARLARLTVASTAVGDVESLLNEQPTSIPALDVVVDEFELRGKRLGRLQVDAVNRSSGAQTREWRLNKLNLSMPEAVLTASGNWTRVNAPSAAERRRTVLNFKLDIADAGELLTRLGMKDVLRKGHGKMEGQIGWFGSPITFDTPSLAGAFTVNVESGQFLKADPGISKLLGVLSLQALPRRLTLDFRDVFSEGFAFDFLRGDVAIEQGIAKTNNLQMKGVNAAALMEGRADITKETQDLKVVVIPEINAGTASLIASVINPAIGIGTFLAQLFLRRPLSEAATQEFHIDGSWTDPKIVKVQHKAAAAAPDAGNAKESAR